METLLDNFIKATGWSIFHSIWQGALVYGILLTVVMAFPKLNAKIKHNLAYIALCLMFAGFCATFLSLFQMPEKANELSLTDHSLGLAYTEYLSKLPANWSGVAESLFPYIVTLYGLGLLIQGTLLISGYYKTRQLRKTGYMPVPPEWALAFEEIKHKMKISKKIAFYLSSKVNVPLVIGYFKPVVLFPVALATQMELKQVEAILIHELSHIRRNDYLFNLAKTVMETTLFFNPFIWLSGRLINIEREHACDDLVLKHTGTPLTYAHALLKLELLKSKNTPVLSLAATGKTQYLYQRIKRITDMKTNYINAKQRLVAISLTIATIISLAWASPMKSTALDQAKVQLNSIMHRPIFKPVQEIPEVVRLAASASMVDQDTTKKKTKIRIITTDEKGNTREYNSVKEMPDSIRREVMVRVIPGPHRKLTDSLITLHRKLAPERIKGYIDASDVLEMTAEARKQAEEIRKYYQSPEWKKNIEEIVKNAKEAGKNAKEIELHLKTPEFRTQMRELRIDEGMGNISEKIRSEIREKFNSEEWKKQIDELKKFQNSKEYKELKEKQKKELEKLKKKKGIKTDISDAFMGYSYLPALPNPPSPPAPAPAVAPPAPPIVPEAP